MKAKHASAALATIATVLGTVRASAQTLPPPPAGEDATAKEPAEPAPLVGPMVSPLRIANATASIQFGLLAQPQYEMIGDPAESLTTKNIYLRRIRFIVGGTLLKYFEYFFDTDYPNLFKQDTGADPAAGTAKNAPGLNIQDAFVTFRPVADLVKVDAGFMLPPLSHNAVQGAATLYGWDYFTNTFRRNVNGEVDIFDSLGPGGQPMDPGGRDLGVQARGLVLGDHLEYRVGIFQGFRDAPVPAMGAGNAGQVEGANFFRVASRLQVNILDAEPGYFYQGTYLGARKILSFGGSYDFQNSYKYWAVDGLLDLPVGPGIVTVQVNLVQWDGGSFISTLPKETAIMGEAGYLIVPIMLSPIARFEHLGVDQGPTATAPNEDRYGGGLAFWPFGHYSNLKAFYTRVHRDPAAQDFSQINVQWQLYYY